MAERKRLVLDANILIRASLGVRVRVLIADFVNEVDFYMWQRPMRQKLLDTSANWRHVEASIHRSARRPSSA
jgi:hypothetical protein